MNEIPWILILHIVLMTFTIVGLPLLILITAFNADEKRRSDVYNKYTTFED